MKNPLILKVLVLMVMAAGLLPGAILQAWDHDYDRRAQEAVAGLSRLNGLSHWMPDRPGSWPVLDPQKADIKSVRPAGGVQWDRSTVPARLLRLTMTNYKLQRAADLSGLIDLTHLDLSGNQLRGLNLDGNLSLTHLTLTKNQLTGLDLKACPDLTHLSLSANQLASFDPGGSPYLRELLLSMNKLGKIDLSRNTMLENFEAMNNGLTEISLTANQSLTRLMLSYNKISRLDLSRNRRLSELGVRDNELESLDLSHHPELSELTASRNRLTALDLSRSPRLTVLAVDHNELTRLDLSLAQGLTKLEAQNNPLTAIAVGDNPFENLISLNLDGGRLPLSQLAPLSGRAQNRARFGEQEPVLFESRRLETGAVLDLSAEALINDQPTEFIVLTDKKRRVRPQDYQAAGGLITIKKPGLYLVRMTNEAVFSSEKNPSTSQMRSFKTKVYTGLIEVVAAPTAEPQP